MEVKWTFFFKKEIKISIFQDAGYNLNAAPDMSYSKSSPDLNWIGLLVD